MRFTKTLLLLCLSNLLGMSSAFVSPTPTTTKLQHHGLIHPTTSTNTRSRAGSNKNKASSSSSPSTGLFASRAKASAVSKVSSAALPLVSKVWTWMVKLSTIVFSELKQLTAIQKLLFCGVFFLGLKFGDSALSWKRYTNAVDIRTKYFGQNAPFLTGTVIKVSDGDTLRFLHTPTPFHAKTVDKSKGEKMSEVCLPVRICTIDTPETPKFGKPGQPFGLKAKEALSNLVDGKTIQIRLLQKDQYGRAVAQVFAPGFAVGKKRCVDEVLLKEGLAEVYQGMGAVYGPLGREKYMELEEEARKAKKGMWSQKNRETAAEYKRRTK